jgi:hypothetical protein
MMLESTGTSDLRKRCLLLLTTTHFLAGEFERASEIYAKLIADNAGNLLVLKRQVCDSRCPVRTQADGNVIDHVTLQAAVKRSLGKLSEAVAVLHDIIK